MGTLKTNAYDMFAMPAMTLEEPVYLFVFRFPNESTPSAALKIVNIYTYPKGNAHYTYTSCVLKLIRYTCADS